MQSQSRDEPPQRRSEPPAGAPPVGKQPEEPVLRNEPPRQEPRATSRPEASREDSPIQRTPPRSEAPGEAPPVHRAPPPREEPAVRRYDQFRYEPAGASAAAAGAAAERDEPPTQHRVPPRGERQADLSAYPDERPAYASRALPEEPPPYAGWTRGDDGPRHLRNSDPPSYWWLLWLLLALVAIGAAGWYLWQQRDHGPERPFAVAPPSATSAETKPEILHPVETVEPEKPLPTLDRSDTLMRETATGLLGVAVFQAMFNPQQLARRFVATVDNLPRRPPPGRMMALKPVPGAFSANAGNVKRYAQYVKVLESLDANVLVERYRTYYPLFQRAFVELGYPDGYFNDRLVFAIDDLLAAPELKTPPRLVQPKVLYEYDDPALEMRSTGQKMLMRMGPENAARVKAKLREIRAELVKQPQQ